ncbi:MAG: Sua5/YciO/YrdC/YwlC family protein [Cytophagales bacterium]|nr:Sua5/YciO/YrdC/YwlC family protein [Cytophagales bacterium]
MRRNCRSKGIGGYLLMADATNESAIKKLRERKHRPSKPFALMYPDLEMLERDVN